MIFKTKKQSDCIGCRSYNSIENIRFCRTSNSEFKICNCVCRKCIVKIMCGNFCDEYLNQITSMERLSLLLKKSIMGGESRSNDNKENQYEYSKN